MRITRTLALLAAAASAAVALSTAPAAAAGTPAPDRQAGSVTKISGVVYMGTPHAAAVCGLTGGGDACRTVGANHDSTEVGISMPTRIKVPAGCHLLKQWRWHGTSFWTDPGWTGWGPFDYSFNAGIDVSARLYCT